MFTLEVFQLSLIDDSNVFDVTDQAKKDMRCQYEYNEILTETKGLRIGFKHYDVDNEKNERELELELHVVDLGLTYIQEVNAADGSKLIKNEHKVIRKRSHEKDLVDLSFIGINQKLRQLNNVRSQTSS